MSKKPLLETNPYLRDDEKRRKALVTNVSSNTAVETGRKPEAIARTLARETGRVSLKPRQRSGR
ncbi:MAG: hypothetical protein EPO20_13140 [Betaproteobacteria bacterium]|nr:MAG: hypothetical protein EPO20_13140 [Betaproteobacteria bacterium]